MRILTKTAWLGLLATSPLLHAPDHQFVQIDVPDNAGVMVGIVWLFSDGGGHEFPRSGCHSKTFTTIACP